MKTHPHRLSAAVVLVALVSTACGTSDGGGSDDPPVPAQTLWIESSDWNGWDPDHESTPEIASTEAEVGSSVTVESLGEQITFEVTGVADGEVEVSSDQPLAPSGETGGSDLNDLVEEFTVVAGERTVLDTPTLDAGYSYVVTLAPTGERPTGEG